MAWGIQQHLHPLLDPSRPGWTAALPAALEGAAQSSDQESFRRVLRRLPVPLQDTRTLGGNRRDDPPAGVLPVSWGWIEDRLVILGAAAGTAAGGLRPGDVFATRDGRPAATVLAATEALVSAPIAARRPLALDLLDAGAPGSRVELGIERAGAAPFAVTLTRAAADPPPDTPFPPVTEPRPGVIYVDLRRITDAELETLLPRLAAARGVSFHLRGALR